MNKEGRRIKSSKMVDKRNENSRNEKVEDGDLGRGYSLRR